MKNIKINEKETGIFTLKYFSMSKSRKVADEMIIAGIDCNNIQAHKKLKANQNLVIFFKNFIFSQIIKYIWYYNYEILIKTKILDYDLIYFALAYNIFDIWNTL